MRVRFGRKEGGIAMYAVFVTIDVLADHVEEFTEASFRDAQGSVRDEPGCFRFDILRDGEKSTRFYLYEVYRDEAAFEAHLETPHFKQWKSIVEPMFDGELRRVDLETVFPSNAGWSMQKPGLLNW